MWADNGTMTTTSRPAAPPYWRNALLAALSVIVMFSGSGVVLRATDNLLLAYGFIVLVAATFAGTGVLLKRRADRALSGPERR
jgi:uncharacterized membrane protein YhaH (DUF805 family)